MKYDIIGDIHGHVNDLKDLLKKMGMDYPKGGITSTPIDKQFL